MAGNEYFNLTDENSVALIQNGELLEEQAVLIGGEPYAAYTYVESQLNSCFYWDEETKGILLTTSGGVQTLLPGDAAVAKTPGGQPAVQQESDGTVYISLDVVKEYTDLDYAYYSDPNRVVIRNEWDGVEQATVQSDTAQVRQKGGIKSLILADVQKGGHPAVSGKSGQLVQSHDGGRLYRLHPDRGYLRAGGHRSADGKERFL